MSTKRDEPSKEPVIPGLRAAQNPESRVYQIETGLLAPSMALALRAIGFADVRFGFQPPQSGSRLRRVRNDGMAE